MTITINSYSSGSFDDQFLGLRSASGPLSTISATQMVYGQWAAVGPNNFIYVTPQTVFLGSGFSNGTNGVVNSVIIGVPGVSYYNPGSSPYLRIDGLNVNTAVFHQDPMAAIRSDAIVFNGGSGRDFFTGSAFGDVISGSLGSDVLYGGMGQDTLYGGQEHDSLFGGRAADRLYGGMGEDILQGGLGADYLDGGGDFDVASYENADTGVLVDRDNMALNTGHAQGDTFVGIERVDGSAFSDSLYGTAGFDLFVGGSGDDFIYGRDGNDSLFGGAGNDTLRGGLGNDSLIGDAGNDIFYGGAGGDIFSFQAVQSGIAGGNDTIMDFDVAYDRLSMGYMGITAQNFHLAVSQEGANTVIHAQNGSTITLVNMNMNTFLTYANYDLYQ